MPRTLPWRRSLVLDTAFAAIDAFNDLDDVLELRPIAVRANLAACREFDWNDRVTLYEGGPRAARDVRASRFADC